MSRGVECLKVGPSHLMYLEKYEKVIPGFVTVVTILSYRTEEFWGALINVAPQ